MVGVLSRAEFTTGMEVASAADAFAGRSDGTSKRPPQEVEFPSISRYSDHADEFVRQVIPCAHRLAER